MPVGVYNLTYTVKNSQGLMAMVRRTLTILPTCPQVRLRLPFDLSLVCFTLHSALRLMYGVLRAGWRLMQQSRD